MKILFSPIGTADPITQLGDGPMLHIVRHYRPDVVVLFLSPKMSAYQNSDKRYTEAIERLYAGEGRPSPEIRTVESGNGDVHRFDYHIEEFERILKKLSDECNREPVLANVSSGTPAMQQALVALGSFGRPPLKLLQVTSPRHDANKRQDREDPDKYDLDAMWEWNEELREEDPNACESRIVEVATPNYSARLVRENVVTLINDYEYSAAYDLACATNSVSDEAKGMIRAASERLNLNLNLPARVFAKTSLSVNMTDPLGEYLAVMQVRLNQEHWSDFIRLLTPAYTQLAKDELRKNGLPERAYLKMDGTKASSIMNWNAVENDAQLASILGASRPSRSWRINNNMLSKLVKAYCPQGPTAEKLLKLRDFEYDFRNTLAHELCASSKEAIERNGGLSLEEVMQHLYDLHGNARPHLYDDINRAIIEHL